VSRDVAKKDSLAKQSLRRAPGASPLILGHRGAMAHAPENSLEAFACARDAGADGIELDVRMTGDGEIVVFHDPHLRRLAGRPERISSMKASQLAAVELLSGARIPTLAETLTALPAGFVVNVEIKAEGLAAKRVDRLVEATARVVNECGGHLSVVMSSFSPRVLWHWRSFSDVPAGFLFDGGPGASFRARTARWLLEPTALHPSHRFATAERVKIWREGGLVVNVWTPNTPRDVRAARDSGVDAIITDDPAMAIAALGSS